MAFFSCAMLECPQPTSCWSSQVTSRESYAAHGIEKDSWGRLTKEQWCHPFGRRQREALNGQPRVPLRERWCCFLWLSWDKAGILSEWFCLGHLHRHWDFMPQNDRKWSFPFLTKLLNVDNQLFVIFKFHFIIIVYTNKMFTFIYFYCLTLWPCL